MAATTFGRTGLATLAELQAETSLQNQALANHVHLWVSVDQKRARQLEVSSARRRARPAQRNAILRRPCLHSPAVPEPAMTLTGEILILTGTPGAGKTTTASALAAMPGPPKVHLHADDFWHFIKHGGPPPFLESAHRQNEVVFNVLAHAADGHAKGGYFVVVDGVVGPWFLEAFRRLSSRVHYVVLHIDVESAITRCQARGGKALSDPQVIQSLHEQLTLLDDLGRHALDVRGQPPERTLAKVIAAVESGAYLLHA